MNNKILVLSEGPPPIGDTVAEGGSLRAWGLSKGLLANGHEITFAYRSTFKIGNYEQNEIPEGITLSTWDGERINTLLDNHNVIIMRYAMGEAAEITSRLKKHHILVSDSYIPISIEVSARKSNDQFEQHNFLKLQHSSKIASKRADYILYASPAQKNYYLGYLSGINKLNPKTYSHLTDRMFEIPYGVDPSERPLKKRKLPKQPVLLWYGAFYSWFDMESLIDSIKDISDNVPGFKFMVAGAKNPYNKDPGIMAHYKKTMESIKSAGINVEYVNWHPFKDRFSVYEQATAIITQNHIGLENELAWRTRLMDYVLAGIPILTNGGDPLGEDLIARGIAFRADPGSLLSVFRAVLDKPPKESDFDAAADRYSWTNITFKLSKVLKNSTRLESGEMDLRISVKHILRIIIFKVIRYPLYLKKNGIRKTVSKVKQKIIG
jgi:glycosyltransferase involved in cell wall biosynthesis